LTASLDSIRRIVVLDNSLSLLQFLDLPQIGINQLELKDDVLQLISAEIKLGVHHLFLLLNFVVLLSTFDPLLKHLHEFAILGNSHGSSS